MAESRRERKFRFKGKGERRCIVETVKGKAIGGGDLEIQICGDQERFVEKKIETRDVNEEEAS